MSDCACGAALTDRAGSSVCSRTSAVVVNLTGDSTSCPAAAQPVEAAGA